MKHYALYLLTYTLTLVGVAALSPFTAVPPAFLPAYIAQAALLGAIAGAAIAWLLAGHAAWGQILAGGWVLLALAYGVGQGALAVAAANGVCWGLGILVLLTLAGGMEGRRRG